MTSNTEVLIVSEIGFEKLSSKNKGLGLSFECEHLNISINILSARNVFQGKFMAIYRIG